MNILDSGDSRLFIPATIATWIVVFTVIQIVLFKDTLTSGVIQGFMGGLAYAATVKVLNYLQDRK